MTSFEMIRMIKQLNEGIAFSGKPLKNEPTSSSARPLIRT